MAELQKEVLDSEVDFNGEDASLGGVLRVLKRGVRHLTDGFWEAVVQSALRGRNSLSVEFLSLLVFFAFSSLVFFASLASFPLSTYPVPFAFLGALGGYSIPFRSREYSSGSFCASVTLGVLPLAFVLPQGGLFLLLAATMLGVRLFIGGGKMTEGVAFRALFSALFSALYALLSAELYTSRAVFFVRILAAFLFSGVLTVLFSGIAVKERAAEKETRAFSLFLLPSQLYLYRLLSALGFGFCLLYAIDEAEVFSFSLSFLIAVTVTLAVSQLHGGLPGALCGALLGFAAAGEAGAALLVSALCFSLCLAHSLLFAICLSFAASSGFLLCFCSLSSFSAYSADLLFAHLIFAVFAFFAERRRANCVGEVPLLTARTRASLQEKLSRLSEAFSSLSEVFYTATDVRLTPEGELAERLVQESSERVCASCRRSTDCWERNYGLTRAALSALSVRLYEQRSVGPEDLEAYFKSRCVKAEALCREINRRYARACAAVESREEPASLLCGEYGSISRLLSGEAEQIRLEETLSAQRSEEAERILRALAIPHRSVTVAGGRNAVLTVTGVPLSRLSFSTEQLLTGLSQGLGLSFEAPEFTEPLTDSTMILRRRRAVSLSCARLVVPAGRQTVSGDTTGFFESDESYFYSLICDGMANGRDAAFTSRLSSIFIEKLLTFSHETGVTLEMLNRFLLAGAEERFSTVDLLEVDFYTARANFIKAGAAASYVKRGTGLYRIASKTPPAGILASLTAEQTTITLSPGDSVVMLSDGIAPSEESDAWFAETLAFAKQKDAKSLASYLMGEAQRHHGASRDDMSICVVEVHAA